MDMIIDVHTHLGDILYPGGGELIEKKGIRKKKIFDPVSISEAGLHRNYGLDGLLYRLLARWVTIAERQRNLTATRENFRRSMDGAGVILSACMPIPSHVTFEDLKIASQKDQGIIPFTGIDYTKNYDLEANLEADVKAGARGLKLHPIVQCVPLTSKRTFEVVEAFEPHGLPVLFHCGISSYYLGGEKVKENPTYGEIHYAKELVDAFPRVNFIAGHAGLFEVGDVIEMLGKYKNVWVDISFQSPGTIKKLIKILTPERVLYGSDWPWGNRLTSIKTVKKACQGDKGLERQVFFENAAELMNLSI
ncbi:MAG: amidohydrolase family protein [Deltaproteobacteria bacterium]|nr:amidohydrolase family protein [Deltaproteobacteria bacterium]